MLRNNKVFNNQSKDKPVLDKSQKYDFYESSREQVQETVTTSDGVIVKNRIIDLPVRKKLTKDYFLHNEEVAEDYDIENLQRAGVKMTPFTGSFVSLSIDELSTVVGEITKDMPFPASETTQQNNNVIDMTE